MAEPLELGSHSWKLPHAGVLSIALAFAVGLTAACDGPAALGKGASVDSRFVTSEVARLLTSEGSFPRAAVVDQDFPQLGYAGAKRFADAYVRTFGRISEADWSNEHGHAVDSRRLKACGTVLYAASAYDLAGQNLPPGLRNFIAGQFVVHYCNEADQPQVVVSVSEASTGLRIVRDGRLEFPSDEEGTHAIQAQGIPPELAGDFAVISAESAAQIAWKRTGQRVAAVPTLTRAPFPHGPAFARWRIALEQPVEVTGARSGEVRMTSEIFVGLAVGVHGPSGALKAVSAAETGDRSDEMPVRDGLTGARATRRLLLSASAPRAVEALTTVLGGVR